MPVVNILPSVRLMRPPPYGMCHNSSVSPSYRGSYVAHCVADNVAVRCRIEWAVRGLSFGCQSQLIALASEDPYIEIARVETGTTSNPSSSSQTLSMCIAGERVYALKCDAQTLAVAWHPKASVLAYVQDDDSGSVRLFGALD